MYAPSLRRKEYANGFQKRHCGKIAICQYDNIIDWHEKL